jgi:hypothetical protein
MPIPPIGSILTLECQGAAPGPKFLDGRTREGTVGLAPNIYTSGTQWLLAMHAGAVITLKCMGDLRGARYLDGRTLDATVGLLPDSSAGNSGTRWAISEEPDGSVTLRCLGVADGNRYLDGRTMDGTVGLAPDTGPQFSGTSWRLTVTGKLVMIFCEGDLDKGKRFLDGRTGEGTVGLVDTTHDPFVGTRWHLSGSEDNFTLKCLGGGDGPWYLDGDTASGRVALVPHTNPPFSGTHWRFNRSADGSTLECRGDRRGLNFLDGRTHEGTVALVGDPGDLQGARWRILEPCPPTETHSTGVGAPVTVRIAQLTGSKDPEMRPVINDTTKWGALGLDLGANCVHSDGRIYIFLSDVIPDTSKEGVPQQDSDLVAWLGAPVLGGHEPQGFNFTLPFELSTSQGQREWCYCRNCAALFFNGYAEKGVCPAAEDGHVAGDWRFAIPFEPTNVAGQREWRYCVKCQVMFFELFADRGVCAAGGRHVADGYRFVLPHGQAESPYQADWHFCKLCRVLFYAGVPHEYGACVAGGTAFGLQAVMQAVTNDRPHAVFDPFTVKGAIDKPLNAETPTGTFSYEGQIYVFIWIGNRDKPGAPRQGAYLVSKNDPGIAGPYDERFLFSDFKAYEEAKALNPTNPVNAPKGFWQVAPVVVKNAEVPGLPSAEGDGLLMFGQGWHWGYEDAVHLAWMPLLSRREAQQLHRQPGPQLDQIQYRRANRRGRRPWSTNRAEARALFTMPSHYTSVSAVWLDGPKRWIVLYSRACGDLDLRHYEPTGSVMARLGTTPWSWSDEIEIFNPCREGAYGCYMHWPELGTIYPEISPLMNNETGSAYGAFMLNRFTKWHPKNRMLDIYYLLSLSRPYQTQVMFTKLHVP